ncbi:MAG: hypothetical protein IKQ07_08550 [Bacteroidaceae bacterium]|nr:hypothetical protein [Bacteroidaceae bacterium]
MKKTYIIPVAESISFEVESMIANSVQSVAGDSDLQIGTGDAPATADVKTNTVEWEKWD